MSADDEEAPVAEDALAPAPSHLNFPVVGIGASAGGIGALLRLFEHTPQQSGMAFVVILHLSPKHDSSVDAILRKVTRMPVLQVNEQTPIARDHIYVISPTRQLSMADGHLSVSELERPRGRHVAIDVFFRTLADVHRERSVSIVLSGTGSDGAIGLRHVKERGGVTFAQSPGDAEYDGMPLAAIATGAVDFVMPVIDMPAKLGDLWTNAQRIELPTAEKTGLRVGAAPSSAAEAHAEAALADIMVLLRTRTGHDFRHYKRATVLRRIERRLQVTAVPTLPAYRGYLERHVEETGGLLKDMLISVTSFFRDRESFDALEHQLEAMLAEPQHEGQKVRAWVAGCATGEEAYSVAMLLDENSARKQRPVEFQVFASDIDERAIAVGRAGLYPDTISADVAPARLRHFFSHEQGQYRVRKELRERVLFTAHNLLRDPPFSKLDLVCCRNLLIYLDREVQAQVLEVFHFALQPGGLLFLGTAESADVATGLFSMVDKKNRIYRSNAMLRRARFVPSLPSSAVSPLASTSVEKATPPERSPLGDLHRRLLDRHAPASLLLDAQSNILHSTEHASIYLHFAAGAPTQDLLSVVRPELRLALRTALFQAQQSGRSTEAERVRLERNGVARWLTMTCRPVEAEGGRLMLVNFDEVQATLAVPPADGPAERDPTVVLLEEELHRTRELLHGTVGQSATSAEELRASNEELQAINEELRSTTEELETSKEELQSVNEELITVNAELKDKVDETGKVNDDLKNLIASTDIATIFVDRGLRIKRYTPRAADLFSLIPSDVGRPLTDIRHRLDYAQLEDDASDAFESLRVIEREVAAEDRRIFLARLLPYRTHEDVIEGAVLNCVDITATRRAEDALRAREATLRLVIESARDYAVITLDPQGAVTSWNIGAERLFGWTEAEIAGQPGALVFTPEDRAKGAPEAEMRRAREEGRATDERWHIRKDGSTFFCSGVMTPLYDDGRMRGYSKIARDLTEAKRTEQQQQALLANEQAVRAELQAASMLKDEFLAVMSHELKHPLNLIHVNAEMLSRVPEVRDTPAVARATEVIRRTVLTQARIIDDLLDLSRLHTGKMQLVRTPLAWLPIIQRAIDAAQVDVQAKQLTITAQLDEHASLIYADPARVEQIVWNLLSNSLKFTPPGGTIELRLEEDGALARLDVTDSGEGIDPVFVSHVFDMFRQAKRATTRPQGGLGIGLALVKHLAEQHGGRVAAESAGVGHGARFSVWLPRYSGAEQAGAPLMPASALQGVRILLVDDTPDTLESFGMLLQLEGAVVTTAGSGPEALETAQQPGAEFDLILSDIGMPGMDGYELMRRLRQLDSPVARLPAIALTGFGRQADERRAREAGFDAHLPKPASLDALTALMATLRRSG